jgi:hypothetical protein
LGIWAGDFGGPGSAVALGGYFFDAGVNDYQAIYGVYGVNAGYT